MILTALPLEYKAVLAYLEQRETVTVESTFYTLGTYRGTKAWKVAVACVGPGNAVTAGEAVRGFTHFRPQCAFFVGVAGGVKDVKLGDVVVSTKVYGYESGKADDEFKPRPDVEKGGHGMVSAARHLIGSGAWEKKFESPDGDEVSSIAHIGPIAAGESVVSSTRSELYARIREKYGDAIAVEMEGSGFLKAAWLQCNSNAIVIRGISDLIADKSKADEEGWQPLAATNAAVFAFTLIDLLEKKKV